MTHDLNLPFGFWLKATRESLRKHLPFYLPNSSIGSKRPFFNNPTLSSSNPYPFVQRWTSSDLPLFNKITIPPPDTSEDPLKQHFLTIFGKTSSYLNHSPSLCTTTNTSLLTHVGLPKSHAEHYKSMTLATSEVFYSFIYLPYEFYFFFTSIPLF